MPDEPEPCDKCKHKILRMTAGTTYTCPECGQTWKATDMGVDPV